MITGDEARTRRLVIENCRMLVEAAGYREVVLPTMEPADIYLDRIGTSMLRQMFSLSRRSAEDELTVLRPEGTATLQRWMQLTRGRLCDQRVWYEARCFRRETPQRGRYREFTQFGVEWLMPRDPRAAREEMLDLSEQLVRAWGIEYAIERNVTRGLGYYTGAGWEISMAGLGAQRQVVGGGAYAEGVGFAIGIDRLVLSVMDEG